MVDLLPHHRRQPHRLVEGALWIVALLDGGLVEAKLDVLLHKLLEGRVALERLARRVGAAEGGRDGGKGAE